MNDFWNFLYKTISVACSINYFYMHSTLTVSVFTQCSNQMRHNNTQLKKMNVISYILS